MIWGVSVYPICANEVSAISTYGAIFDESGDNLRSVLSQVTSAIREDDHDTSTYEIMVERS